MRELFYVAPGGKLMATPARAGARLEFGTPEALFAMPRLVTRGSTRQQYATIDGQRFLINEATEPDRAGITAVVNWAEGIRKTK